MNYNYLIKLVFYSMVSVNTFAHAGISLKEVAEFNEVSMRYNSKYGEYFLVHDVIDQNKEKSTRKYLMKFDPFTGKRLESRRYEAYSSPDKAEMEILSSKLKNIESIDDVIRLYGKPSKVWPARDEKIQYDFNDAFETFDLLVQVGKKQKLSFTVTPKKLDN